jgi:23S rRNA pseudouridine2605 synthase
LATVKIWSVITEREKAPKSINGSGAFSRSVNMRLASRPVFVRSSTADAMSEAFSARMGGMRQRLQKLLAVAGVASRRKSEMLISAGRVAVNGEPASLGDSADTVTDAVTLDGAPVVAEKKRYLLLNKPTGYVTTLSDPQGRPTVADLVNVSERVYPVGRLDAETSGLLLLTNDGLFSHRIAHPRFEIDKVYVADVTSPLSDAGKTRLERGVELDDGMTRPAKVELAGHDGKRVRVTIHEGKNRIMRRMLGAVGSPVVALERVGLGELSLEGVRPGEWRDLSGAEVDWLRQAAASTNRKKRQATLS